jgi:2-keto-3-deoxy-L-rhamnonate aldolase RhmA
MMKPNRFIEVRRAGRVPVGHMLFEFGTRAIAQLLDLAGADFVVIDTEHSPFGPAQVADIVAWFRSTSIAPFVRIPEVQYHLVARTLDSGALGIMVPNVASAAQVRAIVDAAKYAPQGQRGVMIGAAHSDYRQVDPGAFMAHSNANTTVICQIESQAGLDDLAAIAAMPGIDVLWVGHFDLTQSLGIPGQFHHPLFLDALKRVVDVGRQHGLGLGIQPTSLAQAQEWLELGFNVISYSGDRFVYAAALAEGIAGVRSMAAST